MLTIEKHAVMNLENAIRGARNPRNSWEKMDSGADQEGVFRLGPKDLALAIKLCRAGSDHRKFMRQIFVSVDITAPLYWWKEFDTYKVGTVANSTSTMHKLHAKPFTLEDFSHDRMDPETMERLSVLIAYLEDCRLKFVETKDKQYWWNMIQLLPTGFNQLRTCTMSYENLLHMYGARRDHKLDEWKTFCAWVQSLPYAKELLCW